MAGIISIRMLLKEKRINHQPNKSSSFFGSVLLGFLFGTGWSPCIGLTLSAILFLASQADSMATGMLLLFIYSMGMGLPFIIVALLWSKSLDKMRKLNKWIPTIQKASGYIMIILGILLFTGQFRVITAYLLRFTPFNF